MEVIDMEFYEYVIMHVIYLSTKEEGDVRVVPTQSQLLNSRKNFDGLINDWLTGDDNHYIVRRRQTSIGTFTACTNRLRAAGLMVPATGARTGYNLTEAGENFVHSCMSRKVYPLAFTYDGEGINIRMEHHYGSN